jgi:hypothetical protein
MNFIVYSFFANKIGVGMGVEVGLWAVNILLFVV